VESAAVFELDTQIYVPSKLLKDVVKSRITTIGVKLLALQHHHSVFLDVPNPNAITASAANVLTLSEEILALCQDIVDRCSEVSWVFLDGPETKALVASSFEEYKQVEEIFQQQLHKCVADNYRICKPIAMAREISDFTLDSAFRGAEMKVIGHPQFVFGLL
jgi:hypothetical protein